METVSRRNAVRAGGGAAVALFAGGQMLIQSSEPALAASGELNAENVTISADDGSPTSLTVTPNITVSWDGQGTPVSEVQATWKVSTDDTSKTTVGETPYSISDFSSTESGSVEHTFTEINLLSDNGGALTASNFAASTDGDSTSTDVTLSMNVTLKDAEANTVDSMDEALGPTTYTVTVENTESSTSSTVSASGTAHTDGT